MKRSFVARACLLCLAAVCLACITSLVLAQTSEISSLRKSVQSSTSDVEKVDLSCRLAEKLYSFDFEEGYAHADAALKLSEQIDYKRGAARALTLIGTYYYYLGNNAEALKYYQEALKSISEEKSNDYPFTTFIRLSILYREQAYFDSAAYYLKKAKVQIRNQPTGALHASWHGSVGLLLNAKSENDSALKHLKTALVIRLKLGDSIRIADTWRSLGVVHTSLSQYDSSEYCYESGQAFIGTIDEPEIQMPLFLRRGETNVAKGEFVKAAGNYKLALGLLTDNTFKRYYSLLLFKIGELYQNQGVYHIAYDYLFRAMKEFESMNARQDQAKALTQIGWCYALQKNYPMAMEYANNSLLVARLISDSASIGQNQTLMGYLLSRQNKIEEALSRFDEALRIRTKIKNWSGVSFTLYDKAVVYIGLGQHARAYDLLYQSLSMNERFGHQVGIVFTCNELGLLFAKDGNFEKSAVYLARANRLAKSIPIPPQLLVNYKNYIFLYESLKNSSKTIEFYKLYTDLKDSLSTASDTSRIAKADALFQLQKKANEISLANEEREVHQERIKVQQAELRFQRNIIIAALIATIFLLILLFIIYRLFVSNRKAKDVLQKKNHEITEQREEILAQSEELTESNYRLSRLNSELTEKNHEIELQAEKIKEANTSLEMRVEERTSQLNTAYNELETFFYKTSHDFRRPLTTYLGLVEVAKVTVRDQQALDLFDKVRQTTAGLDGMLHKLQSISNMEYDGELTEVSITELIVGSLQKNSENIKAKSIKVEVDNEIRLVKTNTTLLNIVLDNLIENSVNFSTPIHPYLRISAAQTNTHATVIVEDNGEGIPTSIQNKIFEMYFRGSTNSRGNGLGLYIAKRAINKLNGSISFVSRVNEGTSFTISFPVESNG